MFIIQTKQITWFVKWGQNVHSVEAEFVVEEAEAVAKVVEKVATVAEKVSEDVAEMLPENGKLRKAALVVERASKEAAHDAQLTEEFIHKVLICFYYLPPLLLGWVWFFRLGRQTHISIQVL